MWEDGGRWLMPIRDREGSGADSDSVYTALSMVK